MSKSQIEYDLDLLARTNNGPLHIDSKRLILAYIDHPTPELWDKCSAIVLYPGRNGYDPKTLWRAVCEVDQKFPKENIPKNRSGRRIWPRIPSADIIENAIARATH